jgi:hypothetical protein
MRCAISSELLVMGSRAKDRIPLLANSRLLRGSFDEPVNGSLGRSLPVRATKRAGQIQRK